MGRNPPSPLSVCRFKRWLGKNEGWCLRRVYTPIHTAGKVRGWGILKNRWILVMGGGLFWNGGVDTPLWTMTQYSNNFNLPLYLLGRLSSWLLFCWLLILKASPWWPMNDCKSFCNLKSARLLESTVVQGRKN